MNYILTVFASIRLLRGFSFHFTNTTLLHSYFGDGPYFVARLITIRHLQFISEIWKIRNICFYRNYPKFQIEDIAKNDFLSIRNVTVDPTAYAHRRVRSRHSYF